MFKARKQLKRLRQNNKQYQKVLNRYQTNISSYIEQKVAAKRNDRITKLLEDQRELFKQERIFEDPIKGSFASVYKNQMKIVENAHQGTGFNNFLHMLHIGKSKTYKPILNLNKTSQLVERERLNLQ